MSTLHKSIKRPVVLAYMLDDDAIEIVLSGPASEPENLPTILAVIAEHMSRAHSLDARQLLDEASDSVGTGYHCVGRKS